MANTTYDTIKNMKPAPWSKSTVADGNALNQNFLEPTHQKDLALATAIDQVKNTVDGYNETINNISNVAEAAKTLANTANDTATDAYEIVQETSGAVAQHGESIEVLDNNFNTLSAAVASEAEAITNLQNNKQDKIYVDANTISGNGTNDSPYTVIGGNQKELEFIDSTTVTVHKDEQDDKIIYSFSAAGGGGGGTSYDYAWIPSVAQNGDISWTWGEYTTAPETQNIQGPAGPQGPSGASGAKGDDGFSPTVTTAGIEPTTEHPQGGTSVTITDKTGEQEFDVWNGANGANGANGTNGISPTISTSPSSTTEHPQGGTHVVISGADGKHEFDVWNGENGAGATNYFDSTTISGAGTQASEYGLKTDAAMYLSNTSAYSATYAEQYWDEVEHNYLTISNVVNYLDTTKIDIPSGTGCENKFWLYHTFGNNGWYEAYSWLCNRFIWENGISGIPNVAEGIVHLGLSGKYVNTSGDTMTGPLVVNSTTNHPFVGISQRGDSDDFAVFGATRKKENNNFGTTWLGVGSNGQGVLKNIPNTSTSASTEPESNGAYTQITFGQNNNAVPSIDINAKLNGSDHNYKSVVVPQQSYDSMSNFDATNGPNYMLKKLSDGSFDIGAKVVNVTSIPQNTEANTYYFVYEV